MTKHFKGDENKVLPVQQVEPYRLWFEFLKLAYQDQDIEVDREHYSLWGDVENAKFNDWWSNHWRELFAVDIGVQKLDSAAISAPSENELLLSVPLYQHPARSIAQIRELLKQHKASERIYNMKAGLFSLYVEAQGKPVHPSVRFLKILGKPRLYLNIYRFWLKHSDAPPRERLERTALSYHAWAQGWNTRVREGRVVKSPDGATKTIRWNRTQIEIPSNIQSYVEYLKARGNRRRAGNSEMGAKLHDDRRQINRYIRKARQIIENTAKGRFTGAYE